MGLQISICLILLAAAVATFFLDGKQWPTFVVTLLFGTYFGHTVPGQWLMERLNDLFRWINGWLS